MAGLYVFAPELMQLLRRALARSAEQVGDRCDVVIEAVFAQKLPC